MNLTPNLANCATGCCTIPILQQPIAELAMQGTPVCDSLTVYACLAQNGRSWDAA